MKNHSAIRRIVAAPYYLWAVIFIAVPLLMVVYYAFTDPSGAFTTGNITELREYGYVFLVSIEYSVIATVIALVLSYPFAYFMSRRRESVQRIMMMLVMLPCG